MDDLALRTEMFNIAHNRSRTGDVAALAEALYEFAKTGEPHRVAIITANNRVSSPASVSDILDMAKGIVQFIDPGATIPNIDLPPPPAPVIPPQQVPTPQFSPVEPS